MRIELLTSAEEAALFPFTGKTAVVFDILRATSTITAAFASGCAKIIPVLSKEEAFALKEGLPGSGVVLAGEREGLMLTGFDRGNSPLEYLTPAIAGKTLILTTSNGTRAIRAASSGSHTLIGSLLNITATVRIALSAGLDICLVCAGSNGSICLEDMLAAGLFTAKALDLSGPHRLSPDDPVIIALRLAQHYADCPLEALYDAAHGLELLGMGLADDLHYCSQVDKYDFACVYREGVITTANPEQISGLHAEY